MREIQLCLDVPIPKENQEKFQKIRNKTLQRYSKSPATHLVVYEQDERTNSWLHGGEVNFIRSAVSELVDGEIQGIDGILPDGVNVAVKVTHEEAERIKGLDGFVIREEYNPNDYLT